MQISMSCYGGPFKRERSMKSSQQERKWANLAKVIDLNHDFAVTNERFSNIIERIFVVPRLIFNSIKKLTEKSKIKFKTFNVENCAHFGVSSMGNDPR